MYNLGEHFKVNYKNNVNQECVFSGNNYRFTILAEGLIRIEYSETNQFTDKLTKLVANREFNKPDFTVKEDHNYLEIKTPLFSLNYQKGKTIKNSKNFKINIGETLNWYYGHVEAKNYNSFINLDRKKQIKSLYSFDGFVSIDDSKSEILEPDGTYTYRDNDQVDIYLFVYYKDFQSCLNNYFKLTGYPALIPRFALGNWWSKNEAYNDQTLKETVDEFAYNEIPISVALLDKDWHIRKYDKKNHLKTGFTFNKELFHSPFDMINYLHSKNIRVGLNIDPTEGLHEIDESFDKAKNYLDINEEGIIPFNVLDYKWLDVYLKLFIHPLDSLGVDFYYLDIEKDDYPIFLLKNYHFNDMNRNYNRRPIVLAYYTDMVQHKYPILYMGKSKVSWDSLKQIPFLNANATNLGNSFYTHDIGGYFKGIEDNELYVRYVQLGAFSPILKFGSDKGKYYKREPWRWNIKTLNIARDYLTLRHKLIPYLYTESYNYHKFGTPLIKPLFYINPEMYDDPIFKDEYFLGTQLFISPIVKQKDYVMNRVVHRFFMPEGLWYDFFTGKKFIGNKTYTSFFKDENYPVFAKAGSIIPMSNDEDVNFTNPPKNLEIQIFPGISNQYDFYEDDGVSSLYKKGFYLLTKIDYNYMPNNYTVIIKALEGKSGIVPEYRNYKLVFRNVKKATDVIVYNNKTKIDCISYTHGNDFIVEVKNIKTINQLSVNCKGKDIEIDATRVINDDIFAILDDLQIETLLKEKIDEVIFSDIPVKKKRIEIRKLRSKGLEQKFVRLFLNLLEYIEQV